MTDQERTDFIFRTVNTPHQFSYENGITVTHVEPGYAKGELVATLADTVGGCCAWSRGGVCVTAGSTMEFLRPASGKKIFCVATPKKMGRTLSVIQVVLTNDQDVVVATGTFTFFMMD